MTHTANYAVSEPGKFRRALAAVTSVNVVEIAV